jgi:hypothetical protein
MVTTSNMVPLNSAFCHGCWASGSPGPSARPLEEVFFTTGISAGNDPPAPARQMCGARAEMCDNSACFSFKARGRVSSSSGDPLRTVPSTRPRTGNVSFFLPQSDNRPDALECPMPARQGDNEPFPPGPPGGGLVCSYAGCVQSRIPVLGLRLPFPPA